MPYQALDDLPLAVREKLPSGAQHIFRSAFNTAYYELDRDMEAATRTAWKAVGNFYEEEIPGGQWRHK